MCVCFLAFQTHPEYELILAHNRDEFYARPSTVASFWTENPSVLAGKDQTAGGTWLGVSLDGKIALVTNFRDPASRRQIAKSRGDLVKDYLMSQTPPLPYLQKVAAVADSYNGFNLVVGSPGQLTYLSALEKTVQSLAPGIYGLSNHLLDTPWPKVKVGKEVFTEIVSRRGDFADPLFALLRVDSPAPDESLPSTGVGLEMERVLSPLFIKSPNYGTRSTTLVLLGREGRCRFVERTYSPGGATWTEKRFSFERRAQ